MKKTGSSFTYEAFISYRHLIRDKTIAERLHKQLETYKVPRTLVKKGYQSAIKSVFRDREELPMSVDLGESIQQALNASRYLIVVCSPNTPESRWVAREVEMFIELGRGDNIIAILIGGTPEESFPKPLLKYLKDKLSECGSKQTELDYFGRYIVDLRAKKVQQSLHLLRKFNVELVSRIIGCNSIELRNYEHKRSIVKIISFTALIIMIIFNFGIYSLFQWRQVIEAKKIVDEQKEIAEEAKIEAEKLKKATLGVIELLTYDLPDRLKNIYGTIPVLTKVLDENIELLDKIREIEPDEKAALREKAVNCLLIGDRWLLLGDTLKGKDYYKESMAIFTELAKDKSSKDAQRNLSISYEKMGYILIETGDIEGAKGYYEKSLAISIDLAKDKSNKEAQRNLSSSYERMGYILLLAGDIEGAKGYHEKCLAISVDLAKDKSNKEAQWDLSYAYKGMGDILLKAGDIEGAKGYYEKSLAISVELAKDKSNKEAQKNLSIIYRKMGEILLKTGDIEGAKGYYEKSLPISVELAKDKSNKEVQWYLLVIYGRMGDILLEAGDIEGAKGYYEKSLPISIELAKDKNNKWVQRDISSTYEGMGDILLLAGDIEGGEGYYEKSLAIMIELAKDKSDKDAQNALESIYFKLSWLELVYDRMGHILLEAGDIEGAKGYYEKSLVISVDLAKDKSNKEAQWDLSYAYEGMGDILLKAGDIEGAKGYYEKCLAIRIELAKDKSNKEAQNDLARIYFSLSWLELVNHNPKGAIEAALKTLEIKPDEVDVKVNLAHGYLFDNQFEKAKEIYLANKDIILHDNKTFGQIVLEDFIKLREYGISHPDMVKIENLLSGKN